MELGGGHSPKGGEESDEKGPPNHLNEAWSKSKRLTVRRRGTNFNQGREERQLK